MFIICHWIVIQLVIILKKKKNKKVNSVQLGTEFTVTFNSGRLPSSVLMNNQLFIVIFWVDWVDGRMCFGVHQCRPWLWFHVNDWVNQVDGYETLMVNSALFTFFCLSYQIDWRLWNDRSSRWCNSIMNHWLISQFLANIYAVSQ